MGFAFNVMSFMVQILLSFTYVVYLDEFAV